MTSWQPLTTPSEHERFGQIMRLMDERYCALTTSELPRWLATKQKNGKHPELFGWHDGDGTAGIRQVMATTCVKDEQGRRTDLGLSMLGVAADVIPEAECTDEYIARWLGRIVIGIKEITPIGEVVRAIRPKTMTWKPIERLHDLMQTGILVQSDDPEEGVLHAEMLDVRDTGHSLYLKMRIVRASDIQPGDRVVML